MLILVRKYFVMKNALAVLLMLISVTAYNQVKPRKLGNTLNNPSFNYWAPYISLDGNTVIFQCDYTEDNTPAPFISVRQGVDWKEPILIPKKFVANAFLKGYTLSADGKTMYSTTTYNSTTGGFDIFIVRFNGTTFTDAISIGAPINSSGHDASPTFSADGNQIYFMRCAKMNANEAEGCKLFTAKKRNGIWETPTELPPSINAGNSQMPRMLADGQTLLFASNMHKPSKGGMDLYMTRLVDNQWSAPVNLDFVNTKGEDIYASASSVGMSLLRDSPGDRKSELVEYFFPADIKPKAVMRVIGVVDGLTDLTKANINIINLNSKQILNTPQADAKGNFTAYIPEGNLYGLFVEAPTENFKYFMKRFDLTAGNKVQNFERVSASLKLLGPGDEMELTTVSFNSFSSEINPISIIELQKVAKMMKGNPAINFNIDVALFGYLKDSIQTKELTEPLPDTVVYQKEFQVDSVTIEMRDSTAIEYLYHNDRTKKQAQSIVDFLVRQGAKPDKISITTKAVEELVAEKRKTVVYLKMK